MEELKNEIKTVAPVPTPPTPEPAPEPKESDIVTLTKGQLDGLLARIEAMENRGAVKRPKRVTEHTATIRFYKGQPIIKYENVRDKKDHDLDKMVSYWDVTTYDGEKHTLKHGEFLKSEGEFAGNTFPVLIKKNTSEEIIEYQGTRRTTNPDEIHNKHFQSREIEMEVTTDIYTSEIEVLSGPDKGKTFTVPTFALNS